MLELETRQAHCEQCKKDVNTREKPGNRNTAQMPFVRIGDCGHVVLERFTKDDLWETAS